MKKRRRAPRARAPRRQAAADVGGMSAAAFARDRGVDEKAVRKAFDSGRLSSAVVGVTRSGRRVITDLEGARREWEANAGQAPRGPVDARDSLAEASRIATIERGRRLRMENDRREGTLIELAAARREAFESSRIIRDAVLNVPARYADELAAETDPARLRERLDDILREALHGAADRLEAAGE